MLDTITVDECAEAVKGPGKFEGERPATRYYYECEMHGDGEFLECGGGECYTVFDVAPDEAQAFSLTAPHYVIHESNDGFVYGWEASAGEVAVLQKAVDDGESY